MGQDKRVKGKYGFVEQGKLRGFREGRVLFRQATINHSPPVDEAPGVQDFEQGCKIVHPPMVL